MVMNNLGACNLEVGRLSLAKEQLFEALKLDDRYPLPHHNLAILASVEKDEASALHHVSEARRLGYTGSSMDMILQKSKEIYARLEPASYVKQPAVQER
jgi:Flp pilus assembly protein TadD